MGRFLRTLPALLFLSPAPAALAQDPPADSPAVTALFAADQAPRSSEGPVDWAAVNAADAERRVQLRALIEQGALRTARDYYHAAFVYQHGTQADDQLLGHVLAVRAVAMGMAEAEGIAAATLDRYLQNSGKAQVYGTQFRYSTETGATQEPYDRQLIPDALRQAAGAHTIAEQAARLGEMAATMKARVEGPNP